MSLGRTSALPSWELSLLSSVIIYDRLGGAHESGASARGLGTMSLDLVSEHSQRLKVTDTVWPAQDSSVGLHKPDARVMSGAVNIFSHPPSPCGTGAGESER